ncbi:hypothetical protein CSB07_01000 [Candidatus Gracilibacteria bacterium]|nr:MAG: hypothetical protein CSB07_01000 [Candidatus Gracilibacteria bacterium]PIE85761.1 MAG: hypothetical protein CSA08_00210 [Candidatus Gracilibacteria bacterium]
MRERIIVLFTVLLLFTTNNAFAGETKIIPIKVKVITKNEDKEINRGQTLTFYGDYFKKVPESYKYISLNFKGVNKDTKLYLALQKLVYLNLIENKKLNIYGNKKLNALAFYKLGEKIFGISLINKEEVNELKSRNAKESDMIRLVNFMKKIDEKEDIDISQIKGENRKMDLKQKIFIDAYNTIVNSHYNKDNLDQIKIWNSAINGIAKGTEDKYTVYFPPTENKNFKEGLNGEYEGIGCYVDMEKPGEVKIVSPITGSPGEKAGLKGGDIVKKVDGKEITFKNSLQEVVSWIKGPAGTKVVLGILRDGKELEISVTRGKIVIKDIEYKLLDKRTFYINIKSFGEKISDNFKLALEELSKQNRVEKVIIDLRNNSGGYLNQVSDMLGYFVKKGETTAYVKHIKGDKKYKSKGYDLIDFSKYKIIILQNSGTASASEIMIGTIKDYYPEAKTIGEKTYGKGSVQTMREYTDGSSLKYTIAKWFTGKTRTGIDGIGIIPDIEVIQDYKNLKKDEVLEKAKNIK